MTQTETATPSEVSFADDVRAVAPAWVVSRAAVGAALLITWLLDLSGVTDGWAGRRFASGALLGWDAGHYKTIAVDGYAAAGDIGLLRFFPLWPLLARVAGGGTSIGASVVLLLGANAGSLVAAALLRRLLRRHLDVRRSTLCGSMLLLAPPAYVGCMGYSEPLALVLLLAGLLCLDDERWWIVAALGFAGGLCRPTGVLFAVPVLVVVLRSGIVRQVGALVPRAAALVAPGAGALTYLAWVGVRYGDWLLPIHQQSAANLRGPSVAPWVTVAHAVRALGSPHDLVVGHKITVIGALLLIAVGASRCPKPLLAYGVVAFVAAISAEQLGSLERYAWGSVVPVLGVIVVVDRNRWATRASFALATAGLVGFAVAGLSGFTTP